MVKIFRLKNYFETKNFETKVVEVLQDDTVAPYLFAVIMDYGKNIGKKRKLEFKFMLLQVRCL